MKGLPSFKMFYSVLKCFNDCNLLLHALNAIAHSSSQSKTHSPITSELCSVLWVTLLVMFVCTFSVSSTRRRKNKKSEW